MSNVIPSRSDWKFNQYEVIDKDTGLLKRDALKEVHILEMLDIVASMFDWQGLPDTYKARSLEQRLLRYGHAIHIVIDGKPYCVEGSGAGLEDVNNDPSLVLASDFHLTPKYLGNYKNIDVNPLGLTFTYYTEGEEIAPQKDEQGAFNQLVKGDGVLMRNDALCRGLMPLFTYTASLLVDAEITLQYALINNRVKALVTAVDDNQKQSWEKVWNDIVAGSRIGVILSQTMSEFQPKLWPYSTSSDGAVKEAIEAIQYIWGSFFNKLGLQSNFNMKREAINSSETGMNTYALLPKVDDMLKRRQEGIESLKRLFPSAFANTSVKLASGWKLQQEDALNQAETMEEETTPEETPEEEGKANEDTN